MKIVIIHGQNHKGSTYNIARIMADKLPGQVEEFFLPRDFDKFCIGCANCIIKQESLCPDYEKLAPITKAMDEADVLIFASPVYVYHVTGPMKSFLDHYAYRWMVHRPEENMFSKQAICISTAAGAGIKSTIKDMEDSLFYWGISKIYKCGVAVRATSFDKINEKIKKKIDRKTTKIANKIKKRSGKVKPGIKTIGFFNIMRSMQKNGWNEADKVYWQNKGWTGKKRPWVLGKN